MKRHAFLEQLERHYPKYLGSVANGQAFEAIVLRGGKAVPQKFQELSRAIAEFQQHEKRTGRPGWTIEWKQWRSQKHGLQQWPEKIVVASEEDYLSLIGKAKEAARFKAILFSLMAWRPELAAWLQRHPAAVLDLESDWDGLKAVVDFILSHSLEDYYLRSMPVPVHTKFIECHAATVLSIVRHLDPDKCREGSSIELVLGLKRKPKFFTIRVLDNQLQRSFLPGVEVFAVSAEGLGNLECPVKEIWIIENTTTLYMLPARANAIAIGGDGYAVTELSGIRALQQARLFYWGDMDEHGFRILSLVRGMYPHVRSVLMDIASFWEHQSGLKEQPAAYQPAAPALLSRSERECYNALQSIQGRIEQEQLKLDYVARVVSEA